MSKKITLHLVLFVICYLLFVTWSHAIELNSPRFKLEMEKVDIDREENKDPAIYTIEDLYGSGALEEFNSYGYIMSLSEAEIPFTFTLSSSLVTFSNGANGNSQDKHIEFSISKDDSYKSKISLVQEYPLKNFSGDTLDLYFSLSNDSVFRKLPNQNSGNFPTVISDSKTKILPRINFKINSRAVPLEGTYDTVINFIASPKN